MKVRCLCQCVSSLYNTCYHIFVTFGSIFIIPSHHVCMYCCFVTFCVAFHHEIFILSICDLFLCFCIALPPEQLVFSVFIHLIMYSMQVDIMFSLLPINNSSFCNLPPHRLTLLVYWTKLRILFLCVSNLSYMDTTFQLCRARAVFIIILIACVACH